MLRLIFASHQEANGTTAYAFVPDNRDFNAVAILDAHDC